MRFGLESVGVRRAGNDSILGNWEQLAPLHGGHFEYFVGSLRKKMHEPCLRRGLCWLVLQLQMRVRVILASEPFADFLFFGIAVQLVGVVR